jgi:hypothetical protein
VTGLSFAKSTSKSNTVTVAKLLDDAHFSCCIFANANRLRAVLEFSSTSFPVNHRHKAVERRRHGFWSAIFQSHPETGWMFTLISSGAGSAHFVRSLGCGRLNSLRALPIGVCPRRPRLLGMDVELGLGTTGATGIPNPSRRLHCI